MRLFLMAGALFAAMSSSAAAARSGNAESVVDGEWRRRCAGDVRALPRRRIPRERDCGGQRRLMKASCAMRTGSAHDRHEQTKGLHGAHVRVALGTSLEAAKAWGSVLGSPMPNVEGTTGMGGGVPIKVGDVAIGAVASAAPLAATRRDLREGRHRENCALTQVAQGSVFGGTGLTLSLYVAGL